MGIVKAPQKSAPKKKHSGFFGSLAHDLGAAVHGTTHVIKGTSGGLYKGVTGLPTGLYGIGRAGIHDVRHDPLSFVNPAALAIHLARGKGQLGHIAHAVAKSEYDQYRHFGRGGDVSGPLLDALAVLSAGGGAAARAGAASRAIKESRAISAGRTGKDLALDTAVTSKRMGHALPPKVLKSMGVTAKEVEKHDARVGDLLQKRLEGKTRKGPGTANVNSRSYNLRQHLGQGAKAAKQQPIYQRSLGYGVMVPTSPNPALRLMRKGREATKRDVTKRNDLRKEIERRKRFAENMGIAYNRKSAKKLSAPPRVQKADDVESMIGKVINYPMAPLRLGMWARPRYYLQNIAQTAQMLALHPARTTRSIGMAAKHPDIAKQFLHALGEAQAGSVGAGLGSSKIGMRLGGKIGGKVGRSIQARGVQGAIGHAANYPEALVRQLSAFNEFQRAGLKTPEAIRNSLQEIKTQGLSAKAFEHLGRAEEEVGAFGRISARERQFMKTQIPIFYPMFKALTRMGVRFPSEHAIVSAAGNRLGRVGKEEQRRLLGDLPFWAQYLIPTHAFDPKAKRGAQAVLNPANIYNLQPGADIGRQMGQMTRHGGPIPGLSLLQETGPLPQILYALATGKDMQTGYPLPGLSSKAPDWQRNPLMAAFLDYAEGLPLADLRTAIGGRQHLRSYEPANSFLEQLAQQMIGPAFIPRTLKTKETTKQAKREKRYGMGRKKPAAVNYGN